MKKAKYSGLIKGLRIGKAKVKQKTFKDESGAYPQENLRISEDMIKKLCKRIPSLKARGQDGSGCFGLKA